MGVPRSTSPRRASAPSRPSTPSKVTTQRSWCGRDDLTVIIETRANAVRDRVSHAALLQAFAQLLARRVGVEMKVELVGAGDTAPLTQIDSRQKPIRLIDERPKATS